MSKPGDFVFTASLGHEDLVAQAYPRISDA